MFYGVKINTFKLQQKL